MVSVLDTFILLVLSFNLCYAWQYSVKQVYWNFTKLEEFIHRYDPLLAWSCALAFYIVIILKG